MTLIVRGIPPEFSWMSDHGFPREQPGGEPPGLLMRVAIYAAVSCKSNGVISHRKATRCFSCRKPGSSSRTPRSGCPTSTSGNSFVSLCLHVGEQPDFLQKVGAQALRLINHERRDLPAGPALAQRALQLLQQHGLRPRRLGAEAQAAGEHFDELAARQDGVVHDTRSAPGGNDPMPGPP